MAQDGRSTGERRQHPRVPSDTCAGVFTGRAFFGLYVVENLSAGGALLSGPRLLDVGTQVRVLLAPPGAGWSWRLALDGYVVRHHPDGGEARFAVAFRNLHPRVEDELQQAVLRRLEWLRQAPAVLVLDDCPGVRRVLARQIGALGKRVIATATPQEATTEMACDDETIAVAIVDLVLPGASGTDFLRFLATEHPRVRRVVMSGAVPAEELRRALAAGIADAALDKPWDKEALVAAVGG